MVNDRKLGDEWEEWDGDLSQLDQKVEAGKRVFLGFAVLSLIFLAAGAAILWYLIKPRLEEFNPHLSRLLGLSILSIFTLLFVSFFLSVLSIIIHRNLTISFYGKKFPLAYLTPIIFQLGQKFGIPYDRMGHSFVSVSNSLMKTTRRKLQTDRIMILLPRCLTVSLQKNIIELAKKYNCMIFTVPGGSLARKLIAREKPKAVIGVACERDLVSGMRDVTQIPVIGIPNTRPEGPCKNTLVDFSQVEEAIRYFLNLDKPILKRKGI